MASHRLASALAQPEEKWIKKCCTTGLFSSFFCHSHWLAARFGCEFFLEKGPVASYYCNNFCFIVCPPKRAGRKNLRSVAWMSWTFCCFLAGAQLEAADDEGEKFSLQYFNSSQKIVVLRYLHCCFLRENSLIRQFFRLRQKRNQRALWYGIRDAIIWHERKFNYHK